MAARSRNDVRPVQRARPARRVGVLSALAAGGSAGLVLTFFRDLLPESRLLALGLGVVCAGLLCFVAGAVVRAVRRRRSGTHSQR